jgi:DNA polymerase-1
LPAGFPRDRIIPVASESTLNYVRDELRKMGKVLGADTESSGLREGDGLDPVSPTSRIILFQIGGRTKVFLVQPELIPAFKAILESDQQVKLFQNGVHDFRFLVAKYGIHVVRMYCTMLSEQVLTAGRVGFGVGLQELVRRYPPHRIISKDVRKEFFEWHPPFSMAQLDYGARDVALLFDVAYSQQLLLKQHTLISTAQLEFDCIPATAEMGLSGVFLDRRYHDQMLAYHSREQQRLERETMAIWNDELRRRGKLQEGLLGEEIRTFNLASNPDKRAALAEIGIDVGDAEYDTLIRLTHPIGKLMAGWSGFTKIVSTYGESMTARIHWHTGRIHSRFDQMGAGESAKAKGKDKAETIATGRYSSDIQQLPKYEVVTVDVDPERELRLRSKFQSIIAAAKAKSAAKKAA